MEIGIKCDDRYLLEAAAKILEDNGFKPLSQHSDKHGDNWNEVDEKTRFIYIEDEFWNYTHNVGGVDKHLKLPKDWQKLYGLMSPDYLLDFTVNEYDPEPYDKFIKFGCATIDNNVFDVVEELELINKHWTENGNKKITGLRIGEGTFTLEQLNKLKNHVERNSKEKQGPNDVSEGNNGGGTVTF